MTSTAAPVVRSSAAWPVLSAVALLAGVTAASIGALSLAAALTATGLPDPGPVTSLGLPFVRAAGEVAAAVAVGGFMFAAFLVPPQGSGVLDADGFRALRLATAACGVWSVCAVLLVPLTVSDVSGEPLTGHLSPIAIWRAADLVDTASAWRWTAALAVLVTVAARAVLRWSWTPMLFGGALLTLMPLALTGHSAAGGSHDVATSSLILHLVAGSMWAGGLLALLAHALRGGRHIALAAGRFSVVALCCFAVMLVSGSANAAVRIRFAELFSTPYGALLLAKVTALVALGAIGWGQRRIAVAALKSGPGTRVPLIRLSMAEALVFGATFGIAVGLGRTPPPPPAVLNPSPAEVALGYDLIGPPSIGGVLLDWRFDLLFGTAAIVSAALYVAAVVRLRRRGGDWPLKRTAAWLLGCALLLFTTSSGLGRYSPAVFSIHMATLVLLSMLIPILGVLAAPAVLALRALSPAGPGEPPGPREWLLAGSGSGWVRFVTRPAVVTVVFAAGFYALYLGGIFDSAGSDHGARLLMTAYFLVSGFLFFSVVIGIDPVRRTVGHLTRIGMVCAAIALQAVFGALLMSMPTIRGERFYRSLQLPWRTDLSGDQQLAGVFAVTVGLLPLVVVLAAVLIQWRRTERAPSATVPAGPADIGT